jgi:hypothetical protein
MKSIPLMMAIKPAGMAQAERPGAEYAALKERNEAQAKRALKAKWKLGAIMEGEVGD